MSAQTVVAPVVAEPTTPIKPSEALRLGRLLRPRRLTDGHEFDGTDGACARGAILAAIGGDNQDVWMDSVRRWPEIYRLMTFCPIGDCWRNERGTASVSHHITHVNDMHHWSDDQIVTWLEELGL